MRGLKWRWTALVVVNNAGPIVILAASVDHAADVSRTACVVSAAALIGLAIVSLFTGFTVKYLPFRLYPVIFTASAALILTGAFT